MTTKNTKSSKAEVDQVVILGDVFSTGERIEETCRLLADANAVGVWATMTLDCH